MPVSTIKFKKCREELKSGNTKNALEVLDEIYTLLKKEDDEFTLMMSRYHRGRNNYLKNIGDPNQFAIETNKINLQILNKLRSLESALKMNNEQIQPDLQRLHQTKSKLKKIKSKISKLEQELIDEHPFKNGIMWLLLLDFNDFLVVIKENYLEKFNENKVLEACNKWRENIKKTMFSRKDNFAETSESFFRDDYPFYPNLIDYFHQKCHLSMGEASYVRIGGILEILSRRVKRRS